MSERNCRCVGEFHSHRCQLETLQAEIFSLKSLLQEREKELRKFGTHQDKACRKAASDYACCCGFGEAIGDKEHGIRPDQTNIALLKSELEIKEERIAILEKELNSWIKNCERWKTENSQLKDRIATLEGALKKIATTEKKDIPGWLVWGQWTSQVAKEALAARPEAGEVK